MLTRKKSHVFAALALMVAVMAMLPTDSLASLSDVGVVGGNVFSTDTLDPPTGLTADTSTPDQVDLVWTPSVDVYADGYHVYDSATSGSGYSLIGSVIGAGATSFTDNSPGDPGCGDSAGYVASETTIETSDVTSIAVTVPAASQVGDVLIGHISVDDDTPGFNTPSGWTLVATNTAGDGWGHAAYYRVADGTEPASYTFSWTISAESTAAISLYSGIDAGAPINATATSHGDDSPLTAPSVVTTVADTVVVRLVSADHSHDFSPPGGHTERYDLSSGDVSGSTADTSQSTIGATGTANFVYGNDKWTTTTIALAAAPPCVPGYYVVRAHVGNWTSIDSNEVLAELASYEDAVLATSGLVSYWRLGASTTVATAPDSFGSNSGIPTVGFTPQVAGALAGDSDTAAQFNGFSAAVDVGNDATLQLSTGSIEAWILTANAGSGLRDIASKVGAFNLMLGNNEIGIYDELSALFVSSGVSLDDGDWHHVVMTFQSGVVGGTRVFVDGGLVLTTTTTIVSQAGSLWIGASQWNGGSEYFAGRIDEAAVYNAVLTPLEIANHYKLGAG